MWSVRDGVSVKVGEEEGGVIYLFQHFVTGNFPTSQHSLRTLILNDNQLETVSFPCNGMVDYY